MSKKQWKNVDLNVQFSSAKKGDWAQEEVEAPLTDVGAIRVQLPTQTNATRQLCELDNISLEGPFILNFSNIPFDATEDEMKSFLRECEVVKIVMNERKRGCGWIELSNFASLSEALKCNDKFFRKRPIRFSIATNEDISRMNGGGSGKYRNQGDSKGYQQSTGSSMTAIDDSDNWRVRKPAQSTEPESLTFARRSATNSASTNAPGSTSSTANSTSWKTGPRNIGKPSTQTSTGVAATDGEDQDNWRRPKLAGETNQSESNPPKFNTNSVPRDRESLTFSRKPKSANSLDNSESTVPPIMETISDEIKETRKVDIFGGAKPIDTSAKEREIEDKLEKQKASAVTTDSVKTDTIPLTKPNAWGIKSSSAGNKPMSSQSSASSTSTGVSSSSVTDAAKSKNLEWRTGAKPSTNSPNSVNPAGLSLSQKPSLNSSRKDVTINKEINVPKTDESTAIVKKKPEPAPIPTVNIWEERKKTKSKQLPLSTPTNNNETKSIGSAINFSSNDNNNNASNITTGTAGNVCTSSSQQHTTMSTDHQFINFAEISSSQETESQCNATYDPSKSSVTPSAYQKTVVISANGPYIDPKTTHRPPQQQSNQQLVTDNTHKLPKVVPLSKPSTVSTTVSNTTNITSNIAANIEAIKLSNPKSSWAKGPPRALLEKTDN